MKRKLIMYFLLGTFVVSSWYSFTGKRDDIAKWAYSYTYVIKHKTKNNIKTNRITSKHNKKVQFISEKEYN